jgi:hypothetical protein
MDGLVSENDSTIVGSFPETSQSEIYKHTKDSDFCEKICVRPYSECREQEANELNKEAGHNSI